jgi:hypothetical protein
VCPFLSCCVRSTLTGAFLAPPEPRRHRPEAPSHPRGSPNVPEFVLEVSILPMPLFRQVSPQRPRSCSPELAAPPQNLFHRGLRSLAPPCRFYAHGRVRRVALNVSDPFPKPLDPRRGQPSHLRRTLAVGPSERDGLPPHHRYDALPRAHPYFMIAYHSTTLRIWPSVSRNC